MSVQQRVAGGLLLRTPSFLRLVTGCWLGRLPCGMAILAISLTLREAGASYGFVGLTLGVFAIATAAGSPVLGRAVDRVGQVRVLVPTALLAALGFVWIAVTPGQPASVLLGTALAGAVTPPLEPCLRVLWPDIVGRERLERAYAADSAAQELVYVAGPLVVAGCVAVLSPAAALWLQAALGLLGVAIFATTEPVRGWRAEPRVPHWLGPLRSKGLAVLLCATCCTGVTIGALSLLLVSYAERYTVPGGAPVLAALNAGGALVGALGYAAIHWRTALTRRVTAAAACLVLGYGLLTTVPPPPVMAGLMVLTGLFLTPLLIGTFLLIADLAPRGTTTEAFAWRVTLFAGGTALGSVAVGAVLNRAGLHWAAACCVLGVVGCLVTLLLGHRLLVTRQAKMTGPPPTA
jgi:MFS family permease